MIAYVGNHAFVMVPDGHVDIGILTAADFVFIEPVGDGRWDARKVDAAEAERLRSEGRAT